MWISWALLDLRTGDLTGSASMAEPTMTASMVKAWIVADYLTRFGMHDDLSTIIRDSANEPSWEIYRQLGREDSIHRMISHCGLTDSSPGEDLSMTLMSARDTVRLGQCIANGTAAGPWTPWLLGEMRAVRGTGDFGVRKAFENSNRIAIKNGWETRANLGGWNVNCLAIADSWALSVLTRYPLELPLSHGAQAIERLTSDLRELGTLNI